MKGIVLIVDQPCLDREALFTLLKRLALDSWEIIKSDTLEDAERALSPEIRIVYIDIFAFQLERSIRFISGIRHAYPWVAIGLYVESEKLNASDNGLPEEWRRRFGHFHKIYKEHIATKRFKDIVEGVFTKGTEYYKRHSARLASLMNSPNTDHQDDWNLNESSTAVDPKTRPFISYARTDIVFVDWLCQKIEENGYIGWLDRKDIKPGEVWDDMIDEALKTSFAMLLVLSPASMRSPNVAKEWRKFQSLGKPIIPLLWQDVQDIEVHFQLINIQYIDFREYRQEGVKELCAQLSRLRS